MLCIVCVFFFKPKTSYEMRISDWSSDVCSSDLHMGRIGGAFQKDHGQPPHALGAFHRSVNLLARCACRKVQPLHAKFAKDAADKCFRCCIERGAMDDDIARLDDGQQRSEEHTSELQSLMRISYAVFCLTQQNKCTQYIM